MRYTVLYRGNLENCNYSCFYCPFSAGRASYDDMNKDMKSLQGFTRWLERHNHTFNIFFTPKGEALIHDWYKKAFVEYSHSKKIRKVVIQTNLSCDTGWVRECNPDTSAFWLTYHPDEVSMDQFIEKCKIIHRFKIPFSVGIVGVKENFDSIKGMHEKLPDDVYLWINAFKRLQGYYTQSEVGFLKSVDPFFSINQVFYKCIVCLSLLY